MPLVDNAVYVAGKRVAEPTGLDQTIETMTKHGGMAWIGLVKPTANELGALAEELGLHELAVEDAVKGHQRSKIERYGNDLSVVARAARYLEDTEAVEFGDIHIFAGANYAVTVRHADSPDLAKVRARLEGEPELLALGPFAVVYGILDEIVDGYLPVVAGLENDIDEIEDQIFAEENSSTLSKRIYELHREVIAFQRAVLPLANVLQELREDLAGSDADIELRRLLRDVHDHALRVNERIDGFRLLLDNALSAHVAIVSRQQTDASFAQNEQIKQISAWAAILFAPSLVGSIYGMNFKHMPELGWVTGYPLALGLMLATSLALYVFFKRMKWL